MVRDGTLKKQNNFALSYFQLKQLYKDTRKNKNMMKWDYLNLATKAAFFPNQHYQPILG